MKRQWCIGRITGEFLARMENLLDLYAKPYDKDYPVVCVDELPCILHGETIKPLPMKVGRVLREHYEYKRNGSCSLFLAFEPQSGYRMVMVSRHRKKADYTRFMQQLAAHYANAKRIKLVQDNLNTHQAGSFYTVLDAKEAWQLTQRFHMHYTPVKGSWLNMAEIELSVISRQCLSRRIETIEMLSAEVEQLVKERNKVNARVNWQFTPEKARVKLARLYEQVKL